MNNNLLLYILYGLVAGFSGYTPVSASAHQALFPMIFRFDSNWPMLRFFVHAGTLGAFVFLCWQRLNHIYREMKIVSLPPKRRNRPPDMDAVLDARVVMMALVPALIGSVCSVFTASSNTSLLLLAVMLIIGAVAIYVPDYVPGGNRKTRAMSTLDGLLLGLCAGCSVIPGVSAVGLMLSVGLLRKCDRSYLLDIALLICGSMLVGMLIVDMLCVLFTAFSGFTFLKLLGCILAAAAAFGGGIGAIFMMRFLTVKTGFSGFVFYGWGLGLFSFILYLMV